MCPHGGFDDLNDSGDDRRRVPDVFSYRLGRVEKLAESTAEEVARLERDVSTMPTRREHDKLADGLTRLTTHLETYVATANAANAIRERNHAEKQTVRLQWPMWALMGVTAACAVASFVFH